LNYYFTVASLPMLFYERDMPVSRDAFLEACDKELTPGDRAVVGGASIREMKTSSPTCALLDAWRTWETGLRNELVKLRAQARGWEAAKHLRESGDTPLGPAGIAREAFGQDSPLDGENILNRARWHYIDELEAGHHFDVEKLVAYFLKLQILERKASFRKDEGSEKLESILARKEEDEQE
jgi:hypothetical protein